MFPVSEETSRRSLALPFHTRLERADQERVAEVLASSLR
jgi:dTDP-4-amino-4,6-dideoxygalactose transaminase